MIRQFLDGEYKAPQIAIECIMAADKYAQLDWFKELDNQGVDVLILDRYKTSQCVYAFAQNVPDLWLCNILEELPEATFEFYLDISVEESMSRKGEHGENDLYERNYDLLKRVREEYYDYFKMYEGDGVTAIVNAERTEMEIHKDILEIALGILN